MDYHAYIDAWGGGWLNFVIIFVILALVYYLMDICFHEDINNSDISEIIIFNEESSDTCLLYVIDAENFVLEDIE